MINLNYFLSFILNPNPNNRNKYGNTNKKKNTNLEMFPQWHITIQYN